MVTSQNPKNVSYVCDISSELLFTSRTATKISYLCDICSLRTRMKASYVCIRLWHLFSSHLEPPWKSATFVTSLTSILFTSQTPMKVSYVCDISSLHISNPPRKSETFVYVYDISSLPISTPHESQLRLFTSAASLLFTSQTPMKVSYVCIRLWHLFSSPPMKVSYVCDISDISSLHISNPAWKSATFVTSLTSLLFTSRIPMKVSYVCDISSLHIPNPHESQLRSWHLFSSHLKPPWKSATFQTPLLFTSRTPMKVSYACDISSLYISTPHDSQLRRWQLFSSHLEPAWQSATFVTSLLFTSRTPMKVSYVCDISSLHISNPMKVSKVCDISDISSLHISTPHESQLRLWHLFSSHLNPPWKSATFVYVCNISPVHISNPHESQLRLQHLWHLFSSHLNPPWKSATFVTSLTSLLFTSQTPHESQLRLFTFVTSLLFTSHTPMKVSYVCDISSLHISTSHGSQLRLHTFATSLLFTSQIPNESQLRLFTFVTSLLFTSQPPMKVSYVCDISSFHISGPHESQLRLRHLFSSHLKPRMKVNYVCKRLWHLFTSHLKPHESPLRLYTFVLFTSQTPTQVTYVCDISDISSLHISTPPWKTATFVKDYDISSLPISTPHESQLRLWHLWLLFSSHLKPHGSLLRLYRFVLFTSQTPMEVSYVCDISDISSLHISNPPWKSATFVNGCDISSLHISNAHESQLRLYTILTSLLFTSQTPTKVSYGCIRLWHLFSSHLNPPTKVSYVCDISDMSSLHISTPHEMQLRLWHLFSSHLKHPWKSDTFVTALLFASQTRHESQLRLWHLFSSHLKPHESQLRLWHLWHLFSSHLTPPWKSATFVTSLTSLLFTSEPPWKSATFVTSLTSLLFTSEPPWKSATFAYVCDISSLHISTPHESQLRLYSFVTSVLITSQTPMKVSYVCIRFWHLFSSNLKRAWQSAMFV